MAGWLAGLDAFVVGLAYLVALLTARFVVRPLLVSVLGAAPLIGGWLAGNVDDGIAGFERAITPAANASLGTLVSALDWLTLQASALIADQVGLADAVYDAFHRLSNLSLPAALSLATQALEGLIADARAYALGLFRSAEHDAEVVATQVAAADQALIASVEGGLRSEISAAEKVVLDEVRKVEQTSGELFLQAEHEAGLLVAASEVKLAELVKAARADLGAAVGAVEHDLQQLARAEKVALEDTSALLSGDLAAARAELEQNVAGVEELVKAEVAKVLGSGPWAAAVAAYEGGEEALRTATLDYVALGYRAIRQELGDAEVIRAKYAPLVRAALAQVGKTA